MDKKFILSFLFIATVIVSSVQANEIIAGDPTKVLIDTTTGTVIFMPRDIDYDYAIKRAQIEANTSVTLEGMKPVSIKDKILGKCHKRG